MLLTTDHIRENPWWADRSVIHADPHLRRLGDQPLVYEHRIPFALDRDAVYTLRGPRQVGKTTLLKRIVRALLTEHDTPSRRILYADVASAGLVTWRELQEFVQAFVDDARQRSAEGRLFVFLDEVTGLEDWGIAIRTLHGRGALDVVTVIATGSHALDVKRGGERAPGRRGEVAHWDWLMMPLCFRDFVGLHAPGLLPTLSPTATLEPRLVYEAAVEAHLSGTRLHTLFDRYLLTGGYPYAIASEHDEGVVATHVHRLYRDAIRGEVARAGLDEAYFRELVTWAGHKRLGREFSWTAASSETAIGSKNTARHYLETAEGLFLWHILYRTLDPTRSRAALKSPKKLYPVDPFAWHVLASWARGEHDTWQGSLGRVADPEIRGDLVESVCADHLRRRFGPFALYHRSKKGRREIDFALFEDGALQALVEVKYQARPRERHRRALAEQGGGILATRDHLEWYADDGVVALPAAYLLALLPWELSLFPDRD